MYPEIHLFGLSIPSYGFMLLLAFFAAFVVALLRSKINGLNKVDVLVAMFMAGVGALLGGKLFYVIQGIPEFLLLHETKGITFLQYFNNSGLVYYGSFIGCILMLVLFCLVYKESFWKVVDTILPSLPLAQAIGRVGCFMVGCCWGIPYEHGCVFHNSPIPGIPTDIPLLPVQLIESICVFILFIVMVVYGRKVRKPGRILSMYLIGYGIIRFVLEFFRYDARRGFVGEFSVSQWISLILIGIGVIILLFYRSKNGRSKKLEN